MDIEKSGDCSADSDHQAARRVARRGAILAGAIVVALIAAACSSDEPGGQGPRSASTTPSSAPQIRPTDRVGTDQVEPGVFAGEGVIISASEDDVASIDPTTLRVQWRADVPGFRAAAGFDSVWVTDLDGQWVRRLDALTGAVQAEIPLPGGPIGILVHRDRVWVGGHRDGTVSGIDPATNKVVSVTRVGPAGPGGPLTSRRRATSCMSS
jgi:hypothetical protein